LFFYRQDHLWQRLQLWGGLKAIEIDSDHSSKTIYGNSCFQCLIDY
jgi:hypothetical protein